MTKGKSMAGLELEGINTNPERVRAIKRLSKGAGLMRKPDDYDPHVFAGLDWDGLLGILFRALRQMPDWRSTRAIFAALNFDDAFIPPMDEVITPETLLTERREAFAAKESVSLRTVMRMEEQGALMLDDYIRRLTAPKTYSTLDIEITDALNELGHALKARPVSKATLKRYYDLHEAVLNERHEHRKVRNATDA